MAKVKLYEMIERELTPEELKASNEKYEQWRSEQRIDDMALASFLSDKLDNIKNIMEAIDKLSVTKDGQVIRKNVSLLNSQHPDNMQQLYQENEHLKRELSEMKEDMKDIKELLKQNLRHE